MNIVSTDTYLHMTVMGLLPVDIWDFVIMSSISMSVPVLGRPSRGHSVWWNSVTVNPSICFPLAGYKEYTDSQEIESLAREYTELSQEDTLYSTHTVHGYSSYIVCCCISHMPAINILLGE